ncbi:hypothetical protein LOK49_LG07G02166 [Camellia lanceoleosa]|uniref:Uncharacterized protein n=1 Tax=Camellia lanceoleosa TaxID=1840588 RepID=A0ACC0H3H0_9ERIC|nr:hypothetical protein LOK49_LG07G02166 [Camellia lanceoleosa]
MYTIQNKSTSFCCGKVDNVGGCRCCCGCGGGGGVLVLGRGSETEEIMIFTEDAEEDRADSWADWAVGKHQLYLLQMLGGLMVKSGGTKMELSIMQPDDWHLHLRDGDLLEAVISHSAFHFGRGIVMPNLKPPIKTTAAAVAYQESILKALPANSDFIPLMTLYLTDTTTPEEIKLARDSGVVYAVKLYPAGATTNSQYGVTDLFGKCLPVHGKVTDPEVDIFDRERVFIDTVLRPLIQKFPQLKVAMEHVTTADAVRGMSSSNNYSSGAETLDLRYEALKHECGVKAAIRVTESNKPSKGRLYVIYAAATGEWAYTPSSGVMPHTDETMEEFHTRHDAEFHDDADLKVVHPSELNKKRPSNTDGSSTKSKRKKKFTGAILLTKTLDRIVNVVESSSTTSTQTSLRYPSIAECLAKLESIPGVSSNDELYVWAARLFL